MKNLILLIILNLLISCSERKQQETKSYHQLTTNDIMTIYKNGYLQGQKSILTCPQNWSYKLKREYINLEWQRDSLNMTFNFH